MHIRRIDALLFLMSVIWGTNYVIVKRAFTQIDPHAFNAIRMVVASTVFVAAMVAVRSRHLAGSLASVLYTPSPMARRDLIGLAGLGVVGQSLYQYWFVGGLARTSVANAALMLAAAPVLIALMSAALGEERVTFTHSVGALLSLAGIYIVVGPGVRVGGTTWVGDLMMLGAVCCWAIYTLGSRPLMLRHSPLAVTGISMAIGTTLYVPAVLPHLRAVAWDEVGQERGLPSCIQGSSRSAFPTRFGTQRFDRSEARERRSIRIWFRWSRWERPRCFSMSRATSEKSLAPRRSSLVSHSLG